MAAKSLRILLSLLPPAVLMMPKSRAGGLAALCIFAAAAVLLILKGKETKREQTAEQTVGCIVLSLVMGLFFYLRWSTSGRFAALSSAAGLPTKQLCALAAAVLCFATCFSLNYLSTYLSLPVSEKRHEKGAVLLLIFLTAFLTITLASKCSPLYPFNDWVDPNTMFTVGKGMLRGRIPYRDLYEQKGPLLMALHALGAWISFDSFLGIWLLEIGACFCYLFLQFKILAYRFGRRAAAIIPLLALITYVPPAFVQGDSAEEFALPLLTYAIYLGVKSIHADKLPDRKDQILLGITSGCILWIKFSMLGFYFGWFLFFVLWAFRRKNSAELIRIIPGIAAGVMIISVPVLLYFFLNHALDIFAECYFINNVRYYPAFGSAEGPFRLAVNLWNGVRRFLEANPMVPVLFAAGLVWCFMRDEKNLAAFLLLTGLSGFLIIFMNGTSFPYYTFVFGCFSVLGLMWLSEIPQTGESMLSLSLKISFFACAAGILSFSENMYLLAYEKKDFPQFRAAEVIRQSGIENPSVLHYGLLDAGFNMDQGLVPGQRFFCHFNLLLPEQETEQKRYIDESVTDYVITCHLPLFETDNYELAGTFPGDFQKNGNSSQFFLYQRVREADHRD